MSRPRQAETSVAAVVPAAGKGTRMGGGLPKPYRLILGRPLLVRTLDALSRAWRFREIVVVTDPEMMTRARKLLDRYGYPQARLISGGRTRAESVRNGVHALQADARLVLVHDAARPLVERSVVRDTLKAAAQTGAALCAVGVSSTVKRSEDRGRHAAGTEDRSKLFLAQTPQVFKRALLLERYRLLGRKALSATDEAALFDGSRVRVRLVAGRETNLKVTTPSDLRLLETYLRGR